MISFCRELGPLAGTNWKRFLGGGSASNILGASEECQMEGSGPGKGLGIAGSMGRERLRGIGCLGRWEVWIRWKKVIKTIVQAILL